MWLNIGIGYSEKYEGFVKFWIGNKDHGKHDRIWSIAIENALILKMHRETLE